MSNQTLENLLHEDRTFPPEPEFAAAANMTAERVAAAVEDRLGFWESQAQRLEWERPWDQVLDTTRTTRARTRR